MCKLGHAKKIAGFTLIELMIALVLGLLVLAAITAVMISTIITNSANLNMIRLDQDLRNIMLLMTHDIRRVGSWTDTRDITTFYPAPNDTVNIIRYDLGMNMNCNPFMQQTTIDSRCPDSASMVASTDLDPDPIPSDPIVSPATSVLGSQTSNCILFSYDVNNDGTLQIANPDERFGFRLFNNAVQIRQNGADCDDSGWQNITDPNTIVITNLNFTVNSTCNVIPGSRITQNCPTSPSPLPLCYAQCDARIVVRDVTIEIIGQINIGGNQTAIRRILETVRVRNDLYIPAT